ncbi:MAG: TIGR02206 family membrane protein [Bacteroidetes bacterium]|nr:TIGR02206 family membrane protein [Bacteroidota bacterium]MDA0860884.1 TIGR02206 family membrane protein [Bacteroidota bacterium]MDA1319094.1 TIGR02206 family membrane protein [Bacteroidota bacterium]
MINVLNNKYPNYIIEFMTEEWVRNNLIALISMLSVLVVGRFLNKKKNTYVLYAMGLILVFSSIYSPLRSYSIGDWNTATDLPLHLCGISGLICAILPFLKRKQILFDFVFYTGIIGGIMSMLTPQMNSYDGSQFAYLEYYVRHSIILVMPIYLLQNYGMELTKKSMMRTFITLNVLLAIIMPFNFYVGGNYMYLAEPPQVENPLVIGEWPYYVLWFEVFMIVLLLLLFYSSKIHLRQIFKFSV